MCWSGQGTTVEIVFWILTLLIDHYQNTEINFKSDPHDLTNTANI